MKNAVITILSLLVLTLGGYIIYDNVIKENEQKKDNDVEETNDEVSLDIVNNLFDRISNVGPCGESILELDNTLSIEEFDKKNNGVYISQYVVHSLFIDNLVNENKAENKYTINVEDYKAEYEKLLGKKSVDLPESIRSGFVMFNLNGDIYDGEIIKGTGCGPSGKYLLDSYKSSNDTLTLTVIYVWKASDGKYSVDSSLDNAKEYTEEEIKKLDNLIKYDYNFTKKGSNYILSSIGNSK